VKKIQYETKEMIRISPEPTRYKLMLNNKIIKHTMGVENLGTKITTNARADEEIEHQLTKSNLIWKNIIAYSRCENLDDETRLVKKARDNKRHTKWVVQGKDSGTTYTL
jgi:hypothetical protein